MILWIVQNYKAVIAFGVAVVTSIFIPSLIALLGFTTDTKATMAAVRVHDTRIQKLEQTTYGMDGKLDLILQSQRRIEERYLRNKNK